MKTRLFLLCMAIALPLHLQAEESALEKVERKVKQAAEATGDAVKNAARKTGNAIENAAEKTKDAAERTGDKLKGDGTTTEERVVTTAKTVETDAHDSSLYQHVEREAGPLTPEQKTQYQSALEEARAKVDAAELEFADRISQITGVTKQKASEIVYEHGF